MVIYRATRIHMWDPMARNKYHGVLSESLFFAYHLIFIKFSLNQNTRSYVGIRDISFPRKWCYVLW